MTTKEKLKTLLKDYPIIFSAYENVSMQMFLDNEEYLDALIEFFSETPTYTSYICYVTYYISENSQGERVYILDFNFSIEEDYFLILKSTFEDGLRLLRIDIPNIRFSYSKKEV